MELCHEEISRRDMHEPCDRRAITTALDEDGNSYPVCVRHDRTGSAARADLLARRPEVMGVGTASSLVQLEVMSA